MIGTVSKSEVLSRILPQRMAIYRGPARGDMVALTFDDGPDEMTPRYLDLLDDLGVPATFFVVGQEVARRRGLFFEYLGRGHEVASHGYTHRRLPALDPGDVVEEIVRTERLLPPRHTGSPLLRPPFGAISARVLLQIALREHRTVMWSLDSLDHRHHDAKRVMEHVMASRVRAGEILLFHEGQRWTLEALPHIVGWLRQQGLRPVTLSRMLWGGEAW